MATGNFIVQNGLTVGGVTIDATSGNITTAGVVATTNTTYPATFNDITITGNISSSATGFFDIPSGTSAQRPASPNTGMIRYNSDLGSYEGYGAGSSWSSLGGVKSVDGKAYIIAETSAGAGDDVIRVYAGDGGTSTQVMWASTSNVKILPSTTSTGAGTGALQVVGGASIGGNLYVNGNLTINGSTSQVGTSNLTINDSMIDLHTSANLAPLTSDDGRDVGIKFHYYKGADSVAFAGWGNDSGYFEYYASGSEGAGNVFVGTSYGTFKGGAFIAANTTAASSTTTGALQVAGGVGIAGALYNGGNHVITATTQSTSTTTGALQVAGGISTQANLYIGGTGGTTAITHTGHILPSANASYNLGSATAWYSNFYGLATQAKYADLAENYQADVSYNAGQVLEFGGSAEVTLGTPDSKRVAGVVSTNPAHLMNGGLTGNNVVPLALTGRVPCNVIGPVAKGDLMVSAGFGYAKTNNNAQVGQVIGKALADFTGAKGQIEVVVGRF